MEDNPLRGRRILVIEDELLISLELESLLHDEGCIVIGPVPSVSRAIAMLDGERPHAVLLDLNLRGERSLCVAAKLAADRVPFVLITGYSRTQSREPELRDRPRVSKPVRRRELVRALAEVLAA